MRYRLPMIKKTILSGITFLVFGFAIAQQADTGKTIVKNGEYYYNLGLEKAQAGELGPALDAFDKSIEIKNDEYVAWYNRGIVKYMMRHYEDALTDLEQAIRLNAAYKKAYLNRGRAKRHLTDYGGAIQDYSRAIQIDSAYGEAYYDRGQIYELFDKMDMACKDFNKAKELGFANAERRVTMCQDLTKRGELHAILWLPKTSANRLYGFSTETPVKVGTGPDGGIANERAYLELLRDAKGNPVRYERVASCCGYASDNAPKGLALLDKYQIVFTNDQGDEKTAFVYLSFYDYEEPMVLNGFNTVNRSKVPVY